MFVVQIAGSVVPAEDTTVTLILNDIWTAKFKLPNTEEYRALSNSSSAVEITYLGRTMFKGLLSKTEFGDDYIDCICRNTVASKMDRKKFYYNGTYAPTFQQEPHHVILSYITQNAGVDFFYTALLAEWDRLSSNFVLSGYYANYFRMSSNFTIGEGIVPSVGALGQMKLGDAILGGS